MKEKSPSNVTLDKSTCQVGGGAQDKKIPGYSKNAYRIALQNLSFLSFWPVTKMNYHLPLCKFGYKEGNCNKYAINMILNKNLFMFFRKKEKGLVMIIFLISETLHK